MIKPEELWIIDGGGYVSGPFKDMEAVYAEAHSIKADPDFQTKGRACVVRVVETLDNFFNNDTALAGESVAREFIRNFPDAKINSECLEDVACITCGARDRFRIAFAGTARVLDEGSEDDGDHEWDADSICVCACGISGKVKDFTIQGLDDMLREVRDQKTEK